ncbi:MAG: TAXI family TRAP transporter solute-binding subunit [Dehalococcoidia bacterium]|nr:TAXI family TRAP transporter solute-binding subunit [Dehalococcoidia bacterium]
MKRTGSCLIVLVLAFALVLSACAPAATPTPIPKQAPAAATTAPAAATSAPAAAATSAPTKASLPAKLEFATHAVGSVFNAIGSGIGKVAASHSGMGVAVTPTGGPPAWIPGLNSSGSPDIGIINTFELWQAYSGKIAPEPIPGDTRTKAPYEPSPNIRILMMGTNNRAGFLVRADSPMKTIKDIKGKTFTWGYQAFPANIPVGLAALANGGLKLDDVKQVPVPEVTAGVQALMEGRAEVTTAAIGMPIVAEADAKIGVRFLEYSTDPKDVKAAQAVMPSGKVDREPVGTAGVKVATPVWSYPISVVGSTHMSDDVAYALVKAWWDNYKELEPIHAQLVGWDPKVFVQEVATVPFHPGAIKFYKEKGIWGAKEDAMQASLLKGELMFLK